MKKFCVIMLLLLALTGCAAQETFETVNDEYVESAMVSMQQVALNLPEDAAVSVLENEAAGKLYLCDGYTVSVQTLEAGDLDKTFQEVTGFSREGLSVLKTEINGVECHSCAWAAAGEGGDQIARTMVLNDGNYHYAVTVMTDASKAGELAKVWQDIFSSVTLTHTDP